MASKRKRRELIAVWRCVDCGKEMTDGAGLHWYYCPGSGKMAPIGVAEDEDDDWDDEPEEDE